MGTWELGQCRDEVLAPGQEGQAVGHRHPSPMAAMIAATATNRMNSAASRGSGLSGSMVSKKMTSRVVALSGTSKTKTKLTNAPSRSGVNH